jgi:ubiquinone/menaquinone biosynthesis C-methylase UbiE
MNATPDRWAHWLTERRDAGVDEQRRLSLDRLRPIRDSVLDRAAPLEGVTLLDVGCGDGLIGLAALELVGPAGAVIFADISPALLRRAERAARNLGLAERTQFLATRAEELDGIADGSVDVVTTRSVLIYVADKRAAFAAMHRVLLPGGRISLFEPVNKLMYPEPDDRLRGYDVAAVRDLADQVKAEYRRMVDPAASSMLDFDDRDLVGYAIEAGFREVHLTLQLDVVPGQMRAASFDSFLDSAPNPLAPTLRESIHGTLKAPARQQLLDHLYEVFMTTEPIQVWAGAYLVARRAVSG